MNCTGSFAGDAYRLQSVTNSAGDITGRGRVCRQPLLQADEQSRFVVFQPAGGRMPTSC